MLDDVKRFDMSVYPTRQKLRPLMWLLCLPACASHRQKLHKINMEGIKPPYLLLSNHNAFLDFKVAAKACFPHRCNYVVAIDGFIGREKLLRAVGGICKRKFTNDIRLVRHLKRVIDNGDIAIIYPEARYSLCGTTAVMPASNGKLAKLLKVPLVTLICRGHHVNSPFWNLKGKHVKGIEADLTCIATAEEVKELPVEELNRRIREAFAYDDFAWQKEKGVRVKYKKRAEGLHKVLYQCPHCGKEYKMTTSGTTLKCNACGKEWTMTELGELVAKAGETEFSHIPDWYEWERANVAAEVSRGEYSFSCKAHVKALPDTKFIDLGAATFTHDAKGFLLQGEENGKPYEIKIGVPESYSVHIEYEYLGKYGDCVDLNTLNDTMYVFPEAEEFSVTKISLATEELYKKYIAEEAAKK